MAQTSSSSAATNAAAPAFREKAFAVLGALALGAALIAMFLSVACSSNSTSTGSADNSGAANAAASAPISVYSREDGSGTRGAFIELVGLEEKGADGKKVDKTTDSAVITNSTSVMMTSVAGDDAGIGYISLGSLNPTVSAVQIDGVEATGANVKSGKYKLSRPFNIVTRPGLQEAAQDFMNFILSNDGQAIVENNGYVAVEDNAKPYTSSGVTGKVVVAGSSSVTPVMEKLAEAYKAKNSGVTVEVQQSDSTTGVTMATEGNCDIGMASRELKDTEKAKGVSSKAIALDGIAVIVSPKSSVKDLSTSEVKEIFSGAVTTWSQILH